MRGKLWICKEKENSAQTILTLRVASPGARMREENACAKSPRVRCLVRNSRGLCYEGKDGVRCMTSA